MINRVLIRIKVVQMMYSYLLTRSVKTQAAALKELEQSLDKSYELYNYLLLLPIDLTDLQERIVDEARHKVFATPEELHPNMRFINNAFVQKLRELEPLQKFVREKKFTWRDDEVFLRLLLGKITESRYYAHYMTASESSFEADGDLWRDLMRHLLLIDPDVEEEIENRSAFWSVEDLDMMGQFAIKTIRLITKGSSEPMFPQFKDAEDSRFAQDLFECAVKEMDENSERIDAAVKSDRWDPERVAVLDRVVMLVALAEARNFFKIPISVTLNEYIEIAKNFSTPQSGQFVNGVLHTAITNLRNEGELNRP